MSLPIVNMDNFSCLLFFWTYSSSLNLFVINHKLPFQAATSSLLIGLGLEDRLSINHTLFIRVSDGTIVAKVQVSGP